MYVLPLLLVGGEQASKMELTRTDVPTPRPDDGPQPQHIGRHVSCQVHVYTSIK